MAWGVPPPGGGGKRGIRHQMVSYPPLNSPSSSLGRDSLRSRVKKRGAHRGVWCSKGTPLMEAEFFAAERCRPVPSGRALSCAANHAREIQGLTASQNLPDARNRAPVSPVSLHISDVSAQRRVWGSQERAREPYGALAPFCRRRQTAAFPAAAGGHSSRPKTGRFSPPAAHRCIGGTACPLLREKEGHSPPCGEISCTARQDLI